MRNGWISDSESEVVKCAGIARWRRSILVSLAAIVAVMPQVRADFFISTSGRDSNPGTREAPFASFEAARDAVRALKSAGGLPKGGVTIWIGGGDYFRTSTFELSRPDSGTAEQPVTWRAGDGGLVRVLGGRRITLGPVTNPEVLARWDPLARPHILEADLGDWSLTNGLGLVSRGFGRATVPSHLEVFHGTRPMTLARWPNEGFFETIAGFPDEAGKGDEHGGKIGDLVSGFTYQGDRPLRWRKAEDIWVHGYWSWDWANSYERVASLDTAKRWVRTAPPHGLYGFRKGQRFYYLNVLEELDQAGEWYFDEASKKLYFWPPGSDRDAKVAGGLPETLVSVVSGPLVALADVSHVTLRGMTFEVSRGNGVKIWGGTGNTVAGCVLRNLGNYGVEVEGGKGHAIIGCDVRDTGDGGVSLSGGDRNSLTPAGHRVENCLFERQGRWSKCYVPAVHLQGVGMRVAHNLIRDHPHCGILFWGNDHLIEGNEIHHVAMETGDVGAIYTGRDYTFRGNRILNNFIHHVGGVGMGAMGVYMDDCVSGTEIRGNIFYKVQRAAFLGGGRDHIVANNVFVECDHAVELDGRGLDRSPVWRDMVNTTMRERLAQMPQGLYRERYPALQGLDAYFGAPGQVPITGEAFAGVPPQNNVVDRNVCVGKWLKVGWHATQDMLRLGTNLTVADPGFAGRIGDSSGVEAFALKPDSPAWAMGFKEIPVTDIGLQKDEFRGDRPDRGGRP